MQRSIGTLLGRIGAAALRGKPHAHAMTTQHRAMAAAPMFDAEVMGRMAPNVRAPLVAIH